MQTICEPKDPIVLRGIREVEDIIASQHNVPDDGALCLQIRQVGQLFVGHGGADGKGTHEQERNCLIALPHVQSPEPYSTRYKRILARSLATLL